MIPEIRLALRNLSRYPGFAAAVVLTMALGIGVNATMFALLDQVLIRPLPYLDPEQIVALQDLQGTDVTLASGIEWFYWSAQNRLFSSVATHYMAWKSLAGKKEPARVRCEMVSSGYFSMFGWGTMVGRGFAPA